MNDLFISSSFTIACLILFVIVANYYINNHILNPGCKEPEKKTLRRVRRYAPAPIQGR